ncbi:tRNA (5-methylaminomethyl-2-thiouridylate)-methyltransferase [Bartonella australis AUST/NH1]|uniref:tRNA-specific 2-thiouridylase MnmA n=1 Tax=Bartonella australis (strain Aust/NH1) TaxID=1094489 RepID=M1N4E5_BARAA|nr:tRNA 2-thiouridine(34) synthase MnmA [Bartonella australis]AGF74774.1 tRNA (5-methylaminomethyl-2-thiouridylate)-methyltransferase [Bartonella australis AUST/NH1]
MFLNSLDLPRPPGESRIVVAMSGGVDSSVVAGLLKKEGYDVVGITLQLYDYGAATNRVGTCCAGQDIEDARRVAEILEIPHYVLDYEARFREAVIDPFAESYAHGETPIPCVACNQTVKFADLLKTAQELGADALATGHYIRSRSHGTHRALFRPLDIDRDQSYFLFATTQEQIDYLRFPLGDLPKARVREIAAEMGFVVAHKHDSQDICFVPRGKYSDIIAKLRPEANNPGVIVHIDGQILGTHSGIVNYTVGQRRGIGIATGEALYVIHIDTENARVIVGPHEMLETHKLFLRNVNWLGDEKLDNFPSDGVDIAVKVRSTRPPHFARLHYKGGLFSVDLLESESGVAPGQACVFYSGHNNEARVLGGGFITRTERTAEAEAMLKRVLCDSKAQAPVLSKAKTVIAYR